MLDSMDNAFHRSVMATLTRIELTQKDILKRIELIEALTPTIDKDQLLVDQPFSCIEDFKEFDCTLSDKTKRKQLVCTFFINIYN